ncbi:unnamed protein product, partial [Mycena citricolor]
RLSSQFHCTCIELSKPTDVFAMSLQVEPERSGYSESRYRRWLELALALFGCVRSAAAASLHGLRITESVTRDRVTHTHTHTLGKFIFL